MKIFEKMSGVVAGIFLCLPIQALEDDPRMHIQKLKLGMTPQEINENITRGNCRPVSHPIWEGKKYIRTNGLY
ncbi:MAG: hypothetical protein PHY16_14595 [Methylobacter sp.]|nr:hypothetical protein [Methylobacter sp.]